VLELVAAAAGLSPQLFHVLLSTLMN